jgi:hypothetical protein
LVRMRRLQLQRRNISLRHTSGPPRATPPAARYARARSPSDRRGAATSRTPPPRIVSHQSSLCKSSSVLVSLVDLILVQGCTLLLKNC